MPSTFTRLNNSVSVLNQKKALVTGASSGLGAEFAVQLAATGVTHLMVTARRKERLDELKARLLSWHCMLKVDTISADLSNTAGVSQLTDELERRDFLPDILINNAGLGDIGMFESSDPTKVESMLAVNILALTHLTRWALPHMLKSKAGWICNVGSTAGLIPLPSFAVYAATKAYVNSFSEALRVELHGSGVFVIALCPGPVNTEFGQLAVRPTGHRKFAPPAFFCVDQAIVVRQTLRALARGKGRLIPGFPVRMAMLMAESTPRWILRWVFDWMSGGFRKERLKESQPQA